MIHQLGSFREARGGFRTHGKASIWRKSRSAWSTNPRVAIGNSLFAAKKTPNSPRRSWMRSWSIELAETRPSTADEDIEAITAKDEPLTRRCDVVKTRSTGDAHHARRILVEEKVSSSTGPLDARRNTNAGSGRVALGCGPLAHWDRQHSRESKPQVPPQRKTPYGEDSSVHSRCHDSLRQ